MSRPLLLLGLIAALGVSACAANGDPTPGSSTPGGPSRGPDSASAASLEARDVAILVVEQTPSYLRVVSSARRPRSAFGPAASWNGTGPATHTWKLLGQHGEIKASGGIVARGGTLEAPPNDQAGAPGAIVPRDTLSFTVKVPQPEAGETIEIAPVSGGAPAARWP